MSAPSLRNDPIQPHHDRDESPHHAEDGAALSHRAGTFGDHVPLAQLPSSPTSEEDKTFQITGLSSFPQLESTMKRTPIPWEGQPTQERSTTGKTAEASKSCAPSGGRLCPLDYFWLVFLNYGVTDL